MILSDCHFSVMQILEENAKINQELHHKPQLLQVEKFDWEEFSLESMPWAQDLDILLAADVIYDEGVIESFVSVLQQLLPFVSGGAYVCSTIRNESTYGHFIQLLGLFSSPRFGVFLRLELFFSTFFFSFFLLFFLEKEAFTIEEIIYSPTSSSFCHSNEKKKILHIKTSIVK